MTDKKLTDKEIVKALEEHYKQVDKGYSTHLEYGGKGDEHEEKYIYMLRDVLDLINRLQGENKAFAEIIKKQDDEISGLRKDLLSRKNLEESFSKSVKQFDKKLARTVELTKAEAYKECIEKVKEELKNIAKIDFQGSYYYLVGQALFDNLLK